MKTNHLFGSQDSVVLQAMLCILHLKGRETDLEIATPCSIGKLYNYMNVHFSGTIKKVRLIVCPFYSLLISLKFPHF